MSGAVAPPRLTSRRTTRRVLLETLLLALLVFWLQRHPERWPEIPYAWNPWAPLILDAPPDRFMRLRLAALGLDDEACNAALSQAKMQLRRVPNRETGPGCGFDNAYEIRRSTVMFPASFTLSCGSAVSLALWERHVLAPAARELLGSEVARIDHFGSYACRNVYGRESGPRSQHATADAFDIAGFGLKNGKTVRVVSGWDGDDDNARAFLHAVRDGACGYFDAVLSPDYNAAHHDHFHVDRGGYRACR